ncbi:hypothetical protein [Corallococcus macrosporus]|uniref:hypothetical protein n=1 Tax=Corallococcus macrosporus TaxID=35 RepID=UPI0012FE2FB7|nr:hypothetical protein [Corallococcus macrosporus]
MTRQGKVRKDAGSEAEAIISDVALAAAIKAYACTMRKAAKKARQITLPQPQILPFTTFELTKDKVKNLAKKIQTGNRAEDQDSEFLYLFRLSASNKVQIRIAMESFEAARSYQGSPEYPGKKNLCRLNASGSNKTLIYVGRSYSPRERFKQHLLSSEGGTYAIHFQQWADKLKLQVDYVLYQLRGVDDEAVQVVEDGLWDYFTPMLGRRGDK